MRISPQHPEAISACLIRTVAWAGILLLLLTSIAAVADWHPTTDDTCVLCQLRSHSPGTQTSFFGPIPLLLLNCVIPTPAPSKLQENQPRLASSRSPPLAPSVP
jgi:hypothetical protein